MVRLSCVGQRCLGSQADVSFMAGPPVAPVSEMVPGNEDTETADWICDIHVESIGLSKDGVTTRSTRQNLAFLGSQGFPRVLDTTQD